jgi:hypothetical protein
MTKSGRRLIPKPALPQHMSEIRSSRTKYGQIQYEVYDTARQAARWINACDFPRPDLVEKYLRVGKQPLPERSPGRPKTSLHHQPEESSQPARKIAEVLGVCQTPAELMYVIRFEDSDKPQLITKAFAMKRCARLLLSYYESHLVFDPDQPDSSPIAAAELRLPEIASD